MRSIRERLNSMQPETQPRPAPARSANGIDLIVPGSEHVTSRGTHFIVEQRITDPTDGGLSSVERTLPTILGTGLDDMPAIDPAEILFLDTETTGLDRGTGTHVFLVGLGYFDGSSFIVEQHFLRGLHEEPSMLESILERINRSRLLVTYNGRGFDWPMIAGRLILHGYRDFNQPLHWDLLTSTRRIWRNRLQDCSLGNIEREILGVQRFGDVPGYMIPDLYFAYLRNHDAAPLRPVFSHNQEDIVSLARLADQLIFAHEAPHLALSNPVDQVSFGLSRLNHGFIDEALELICPLLESSAISPDLRFRASRSAAEHLKRRARFDEAMALWHQMTNTTRSANAETTIYPLIELAKVCEHREKDYQRALQYVERARNLVELHGWNQERPAIVHRYARLMRRLERAKSRKQDR